MFRRAARLCLLGAAACSAWGTPARAQEIVFTHAPDGGPPWPVTDIYAIGAEGSNARALTNDGHSHDPAWSPDGRRILFIHDSTPGGRPASGGGLYASRNPVELQEMDADGRNRRLLRRIEPVIYRAAWSPDGKTLAVTCIPEGWAKRARAAGEPMRAGLFLLAADGKGELRLLFRNAFTPAWSPDGKRLAFSVEKPRGKWAVHVGNSDGTGEMALTDPNRMGGSPAWSPDGKRIAFAEFTGPARQQVFVMDADGRNVRQITRDPDWSCGHASWSAGGERIAVSCVSASPCGMVSSVGTVLPECTRRIFVISVRHPERRMRQLWGHDGAFAEFAPAR